MKTKARSVRQALRLVLVLVLAFTPILSVGAFADEASPESPSATEPTISPDATGASAPTVPADVTTPLDTPGIPGTPTPTEPTVPAAPATPTDASDTADTQDSTPPEKAPEASGDSSSAPLLDEPPTNPLIDPSASPLDELLTESLNTPSDEPGMKLMDFEAPEGDGSPETPYLIANVDNLQWMMEQINTAATSAAYNNKCYELTADIDLDGVTWATISSTNATSFKGTFDGKGHAIKNMTIVGTLAYQGLFGYTNGATVTNLTLTNASVTGSTNYTAGLVGYAANSTISQITLTDATVTGSNYTAGLVAYAGNSTISQITLTDATVTGGNYTAGLVGYVTATLISQVALMSATVSGTNYMAGLVGYAAGATTVSNCFVTGTITGTLAVAGLVSYASAAALTIRDCYVNADVTSTNQSAGGLVGVASPCIITNCYVLGAVSGATGAGGIVGSGTGVFQVTNCFALNSTLTVGSEALPGGIAGAVPMTTLYTLSENYVFDGMKFKNSTTPEDESLIIIGATSDRFGGYVSKASLLSAETWTDNGFDTTTWTIEDGKAPILSAFAGNPSVAQTTSFGSFIDNVLTPPASTDASGWYYEDENYKTATEFTISTAEELAFLAQLVSSGLDGFSGRTIKLTADIDLEEYCTANKAKGGWTPIGTNAAPFRGTFDGNGKIISNLSILSTANNLALFGCINGATIKDLALTNLEVINNEAGMNIGGLVAQSNGAASSITRCIVSGHVETGGNPAGGILGSLGGEIAISDCLVEGTIKGTSGVAGIIGGASGTVAPTITNCIVLASLTGATTATNGNVGGIFGNTNSSETVTIKDCRILSENITSMVPGAIYGASTGRTPATTTDVVAWKGLKINGTTLMDMLYNSPSTFDYAKNGTLLSWKLATAEGWPVSFTNNAGAWNYTEGQLPALKVFAGKLSITFPAYMSDSLVKPGTVNKTALASSIEEAEKLQNADYPDGWDDFALSLLRAKLIFDDGESSQVEVDAEKQLLEDALDLLEERAALVFKGLGTEDEPYLVSNAAELHKVKRVVNATGNANEYRDKYYRLTADIDMEGEDWTPIGTPSVAAFAGVFDGNGKTISNLTVTGSSYVALFGSINGATIKNLTLADVEVESSGSNVAGLVGYIAGSQGDSTLSNCEVSGQIRGGGSVGGLVGTAQAANANATITIENCSMTAGITGNGVSNSSVNVGGIIGYMASAATKVVIKNCEVILSDERPITAIGDNVGGIAGISSNNTSMEGCSVVGGSVNGGTYVGGLLGSTAYNSGATLTDCFVQTTVTSSASRAGGLVGYLYGSGNVSATACAFNGTVRGTDYVGGLLGDGSYYTLTDCFVGGIITGANQVGGFLGGTHSTGGASGRIVSSYTTASVYGDTYVGGFVGRQTSNGPLSIVDCRSFGETVGYPEFGLAKTVGALTGDAQYGTANFAQTNALSWKGLKLDKKTLAETGPSDALYNMNRNGAAFLDWSLRFKEGWPSSLTSSDTAWNYIEGKLPVLKSLADKMDSEFPAYMADVPASGEFGDRTDLAKAIAAAQALTSTDYPEEPAMWAELQSILTYAILMSDFYDASQADIDSAEERLLAAIEELNRLSSITFETGDGSIETPYEIANLDQLLKLNRLVNSPDTAVKNKYRVLHYKLTADVDLGENIWLPLGTTSSAFSGGFDGGGHTITNMTVEGETDQAFIGYTSGAVTIKNLTLKDIRVTGQTRVAGLVGYAAGESIGGPETGLTIENCHVSGVIHSIYNSTGGVLGYAFRGATIKNCTASVDIVARQSYVGGIAAYIDYGSIENCSVKNYTETGSLTHNGNDYVGGIVGGVEAGNTYVTTIKNCSVSANLLGTYVGGIIGYGTSGGAEADHLIVSECYFNGVISPTSAQSSAILGGIASTMQNNFKIIDCASNGTITMAATAGGILARFSGTTAPDVSITNCYTTMRIGNSISAGGLVGSISSTAGGKLILSNSFALNEQVGGSGNAHAIHVVGEANSSKLDDAFAGVKAWDKMLIVIDGEQQASPSGALAISYDELQLAAHWPDGFKSAPWTYAAGKLPVLTGSSGMSNSFPEYITSTEGPTLIADTRGLLAAINTADALSQVAYTVDSWATLSEALSVAKTLLYGERSTQAEVDAATTALLEAIDGLEYYREATTLEGDGSKDSPYLIGSVEDYDEMTRLMNIAGTDLYLTAYYRLTADIDLSGSFRSPLPYSNATGTYGALAFSGDFDGNGFTISKLGVRHTYYTGMFGIVKDAYIHDLTLADVDVLGSVYNTGGIAGHIENTLLENVTVSGYVRGRSSTGGIVGGGTSSVMRNCHFKGTAEIAAGGFGYNLGGLAGQFSLLIEDCSVTGKIVYSGTQQSGVYMGGAVGFGGGDIIGCRVEADILYTCYNDGIVRAGDCVGGIAGRFDGNSLVDCYYKGTIEVRGANNGGIVGEFRGRLIKGCVSEGLLDMNWWTDSLSPRPTGGIAGAIFTDPGSTVTIEDSETSMAIDGFQQAGGIAGTAEGTGTLIIKNTKAMNSSIFNPNNNYYVDPFFYGERNFAGTYVSENNYIWGGMLINDKTLDEWLKQTYNEGKYGNGNGGVTIVPGGDPDTPGDPGNNPDPGPGDTGRPPVDQGSGNLSTPPRSPGIGLPSIETTASSTAIASADTTVDNRPANQPPAQTQTQPSTQPEQPQAIPEQDAPLTASEVALTPIPLGLGFQTVANTVLTLTVGFAALGILILGGFVFWRMYKRRID